MVKFVADSSCNTLELQGVSFEAVPMRIYTGKHNFLDDAALQVKELLNVLAERRGPSYTACPSVEAWLNAFEGADEIYVVTISSRLSGSYTSACAARSLYLELHPEAKIRVFDSLSTGPEMQMLLEKLMELTGEGLDFKTVCQEAEAYLRRTRMLFVLQSMHNLAQNGRVSKALAAMAKGLGIRFIGKADDEGTIAQVSKCRGEKAVIPKLLEELKTLGVQGGKIRLGHTENPRLAEAVRQALAKAYPGADISICETRGLCSYYGERGALFLGVETPVL